jgi:DNA-binding CsgD family transcriptional regulator
MSPLRSKNRLDPAIAPTLLDVFARLGKSAFLVTADLEFLWSPLDPSGPGRARAYSDLLRNWPALEAAIDGLLAQEANAPQPFGEGEDGALLTALPLAERRPVGQASRPRQVFLVLHEPGAARPARARDSFRLTPVESALADHICDGISVKQAALRMGISYHTARKYLARVFEKTHVRRQTELVSLLLGAQGHPAPRPGTQRGRGAAAAR